MLIVGLAGGMGCGKSTAFNTFKQQFDCVLGKFAQPLYDIQEMVYTRIEDVYERPDGFVKDRKLLQWLGTDWGRSLDQDLWVKLWKASVDYAERYGFEALIVDDLRFDNEAEAIKSFPNSVIIKLNRPNNVSHAHGGEGIKAHASEAGIDSKYIDHVVDNNGSLEQYQEKLIELVSKLKGKR